MSTPSVEAWRSRAAGLAESLAVRGCLRSERWHAAVAEVPRHVFVPRAAVTVGSGAVDDTGDSEAWLDEVYSDTTLVVRRRSNPARSNDAAAVGVATSSSTMPSLMVEMLEALDVRDGQRVLEIGTGTGYNAGLLCHRLGSDHIVSMDIDSDLVRAARRRLGDLGFAPTLVAANGWSGVPDHGPYDRIIATCAVPSVPLPWIEQLAPGGSMLINVRGDVAGVLCLLTKRDDDEVVGPVLRLGGDFMWLRQDVNAPFREQSTPIAIGARHVFRRHTTVAPIDILDDRDLRWLLQLELPDLLTIRPTEVFDPLARISRPAVLVYARDGSHAQAVTDAEPDGRHRLLQGGPRRLWDTVESAHRLWTRAERPPAARFGIVANPTVQFAWLDDENGWPRWPLPVEHLTS